MRVQASSNFEWLVQRTGCELTARAKAIEAVDTHGRIHGMVALDLWTVSAAHMHVALDSAAGSRALLRPAFEWLFVQGGRSLALGVIRASNLKSLRLAKHLGFRDLTRIRNGWAEGEDMCLLQMRKEECRWLQPPQKKAA